MRKTLTSSLILASAFISAMAAPTFAGDSTFNSAVEFPVKLAGCGVGSVVGVPLGSFKDSVKGGQAAAKYVAKTLGNEDGDGHMLVGYVVGAPFGAVYGAAYGSVDGLVHGFKTGYDKPFSKDAFTFKDE
jgi:hypothetical protein